MLNILLIVIILLIFSYQCNSIITSSLSLKLINKRLMNTNFNHYSTVSSTSSVGSGLDLSGYTAFINFDGFDVKNMTALISFDKGNQCSYSGGIDQSEPGFYRIVSTEDGREIIEATHQVLPEYMFFYDTEKTILWKGTLDMKSKRIVNGQVITNKKRFGLFSYEKELAKFEARIIEPGESVPVIDIPSLSEIPILPPDDFLTPYDMKLHPEIFDPEYVDWFFECEEKLALGQTPPPRPKAFWTPKSNKLNDVERQNVENENASKGKKELRSKEKGGLKGKGF